MEIYRLDQIIPHIYHMHFAKRYDVAVRFLRCQEYYESVNFKGKQFTWLEYMEWFAKEYGRGFSYSEDWSGFNLPSYILDDVYRDVARVPDFNEYDQFMLTQHQWIKRMENGHPYYLIGTSEEASTEKGLLLEHEVAHAMFYTNEDYRLSVMKLYHKLPRKVRNGMAEALVKRGYHASVVEDETQAYMSTGLAEWLVLEGPSICHPFEDNFKKFYEASKR